VLAFREGGEEGGVVLGGVLAPGAVAGEEALECVWWGLEWEVRKGERTRG